MSALALPLLFALAAQADAPLSLRYDLSAREVPVGEVLQLDVVLGIDPRSRVDELSLPELAPAFTVVRESRSELRSGARAELRFTYLLRAETVGEHRIGEATARSGKATARAAPVTVRVVGDEAPAEGEPDADRPGARFGANPPSSFIELSADPDSAFVGQPIVVSTTVYSQQPLAQAPRLPALKPPGFLCVSLMGDDTSVTPSQLLLKGRSYYAYVLHKDALIPLDEGDKTLPAFTAELTPAGSLFSRARTTTVRSAPLSLRVKELPTEGRPARFSPGNVGQWQLEASARPATVALGQPFTLVVAVSGRGALESLQVPTWDGGGRARVFPPSQRIERQAGDPLSGRVVVETLVQPSEAGELRIPSLVLASFDPERAEYVEARTAPLVVRVKGGGATEEGAPSGEHRTIETAARPLKTRPHAEAPPGEGWVLAGSLAALAGAVTLGALRLRTRRAGSAAGERLQRRQQRARALEQASARGDLSALERTVFDALAERAGDDVRGLPSSELAARLGERGLPAALVAEVIAFIGDVEAARYAPSAGGAARRLAEAARALVAALEASA